MTAHDNEETQLRSVALQNAQGALGARMPGDDAARRHGDLLRITLESIGDGVISTDAQGRVNFMNPVAEKLTGWRSSDGLGRPLRDVFHIVNTHTREPAPNPALDALQHAIAASLPDDTILIARDGVERPIDDSGAPILDANGRPVGAVLVFRDATDRRRAEEAQARLAAIVESSTDAIVSKTIDDGIIRTWNSAAERLFGYTADEAIGKSITLIIPPDRLSEEHRIIERLRRGERVEHFDTVRVAKGGRLVEISVTISPILRADGKIIGASKVARDISERRRLEEELRRRAQELIEADGKKDDFIALLAHELRNPLAPLRNGLEVMRLAGDDAEMLTRTRAMMERQLNHLVRLLDDLLDISRFNRKKIQLRLARVLLHDVINHAVETVQSSLTAAGHEFSLDLPSETLYLNADLSRLSQAFSNLLSNSVKFTEPGGRVWVTAVRDGGKVAVSVHDTGVGIPETDLSHIFDMFSQVGRERGTGLGVGLALARGFVEMHGGTVTAVSNGVGKGSSFTVTLPLPTEHAI